MTEKGHCISVGVLKPIGGRVRLVVMSASAGRFKAFMRTLDPIPTVIVLGVIAFWPVGVSAQVGTVRDAAGRATDAAQEEAANKKETPPATVPAPAIAPAAGSTPAAAPAAPAQAATAPGFEAYSKYDFVPGETVVAVDDFTQDEIGDFPAKWNTNGSGEVVALAGRLGRWLKITKGGFIVPEFVAELSENFTLEFDVTVAPTFDSSYALNVALVQLPNPKGPAPCNRRTTPSR